MEFKKINRNLISSNLIIGKKYFLAMTMRCYDEMFMYTYSLKKNRLG